MGPMRRLTILLLSAAAVADDGFPQQLQVFEEARKFTLEPGGQAHVYPALEGLVATKDVRAVGPLAAYLLETITSERLLLEQAHKLYGKMEDSAHRLEVLARELKQLDLKEKAGDRTIGPLVEQKKAEQAACASEGRLLQKDVEQIDRTVGFLQELRQRLAEGCVTLLQGRTGDEAAEGIRGVCRALDRADHDQALLLVRILGAKGVGGSEDQLVEILSDHKVGDAVRMKAAYALVPRLTRGGAGAILKLWERDPRRLGASASHVLSLAAKKRLATIEDARAWIATLP
jgi:hypothetical protein